ncbi:hypothetical protein GALMADRAFT_208798 [Galerina marginata CBS 339.88]|uniref:Uncharacterized protein n=1 Tax=Galerina marginata (strain CBS 339.88) TaxID=685588 RepID=A0A067T8E0_GALM3|nr:hypothetical protein GALMADRAFT_208798 [Galerina marginata CBS 339.88]
MNGFSPARQTVTCSSKHKPLASRSCSVRPVKGLFIVIPSRPSQVTQSLGVPEYNFGGIAESILGALDTGSLEDENKDEELEDLDDLMTIVFLIDALAAGKIPDDIVDEHTVLLFINFCAGQCKRNRRGEYAPNTRIGAVQENSKSPDFPEDLPICDSLPSLGFEILPHSATSETSSISMSASQNDQAQPNNFGFSTSTTFIDNSYAAFSSLMRNGNWNCSQSGCYSYRGSIKHQASDIIQPSPPPHFFSHVALCESAAVLFSSTSPSPAHLPRLELEGMSGNAPPLGIGSVLGTAGKAEGAEGGGDGGAGGSSPGTEAEVGHAAWNEGNRGHNSLPHEAVKPKEGADIGLGTDKDAAGCPVALDFWWNGFRW